MKSKSRAKRGGNPKKVDEGKKKLNGTSECMGKTFQAATTNT